MNNIDWTCDHCNRPINDHAGYIHVSYADIDRYDTAVPEWKAKHQQPIDGLILTFASAYSDYPAAAQWTATHGICDPNPDAHDYWMSVERLRTYERLLEFTAHLMDKTWIDSTNWPKFLRRTIAANRKVQA